MSEEAKDEVRMNEKSGEVEEEVVKGRRARKDRV